ncbi:transcriptional regulator [Alteribacter lacisalsi]|uniref:Transcriptional regulator n=1 Tax=Alteribacter lacisalsi TaxID=2045244 RepID=A0A2W0H6L1_9BACI|nr:DUF4188 domain-containing protein [Alteribacter lacisalsi]PYZ96346.1 transcriptional regulator [Alteribacter lacisalsi]
MINPGRYTTPQDEDLVVFIIGMRINKWHAITRWWPVLTAMPPMIRELLTNKDIGCLAAESFFGLRTTLMVQYWRSEKDLLAYARGEKHMKAWKNFYTKTARNNAVGIYHETYVVPKGNYESIYGNMPPFGLSRALGSQPVSHTLETAGQRLAGKQKQGGA